MKHSTELKIKNSAWKKKSIHHNISTIYLDKYQTMSAIFTKMTHCHSQSTEDKAMWPTTFTSNFLKLESSSCSWLDWTGPFDSDCWGNMSSRVIN